MTDIVSLVPTGCPKGIQPHEWREAIAARIDLLADQMCALIATLDQMDSDPDLEPNGDELDVSWPEGFRPFEISVSEDAEEDDPAEDDDAGEDNGDDEPSLGNAGIWRKGGIECDLEADDSDAERPERPPIGYRASKASARHHCG